MLESRGGPGIEIQGIEHNSMQHNIGYGFKKSNVANKSCDSPRTLKVVRLVGLSYDESTLMDIPQSLRICQMKALRF